MRLWHARIALPLVILALGIGGAALIFLSRPAGVRTPVPELRRLVRTVRAEPGEVPIVVRAEGTVQARTEIDLVAEVAGSVSWVSPALRPGGFFDADEVLVRVDQRDYEVALKRARASVSRSQGELALAELNLERQRGLLQRNAAAQAALDEATARARVARAAALDAQASVEQAELDLERTELRAPFAGRVLEQRIDLGQFVSRGTLMARAYSIDTAEVRLPIPDEELSYLELPLGGSDAEAGDRLDGPGVVLSARFAGREHQWQGRIVRSEGRIDPRTRMVHLVAEVRDPYGRHVHPEADRGPDRIPLSVGLFVDAEIEGRVVPGIVALPREAMRGTGRVLVVEDGERLRYRDVDVLRVERNRVLVRGGLAEGEEVCISPLATPVDGMLVSIHSEPPDVAAAPAEPAP